MAGENQKLFFFPKYFLLLLQQRHFATEKPFAFWDRRKASIYKLCYPIAVWKHITEGCLEIFQLSTMMFWLRNQLTVLVTYRRMKTYDKEANHAVGTLKVKYTEAVAERCSLKKVFLEIHKKNTCARVFFDKVAGLRSVTLLKKRLWHKCFPVNFTKFLRTPFL